MSKQKLQTKQTKAEEENKKAINKKIKELKKLFRKQTNNHVGVLYKTLSELVKLRQHSNKDYRPRSLEWESDIELTAMQIRYIFSYQYISSYAQQKIDEGLVFDSTVCHFLAVSTLFREFQWQNKLIDRLIKGDIKVSQVSELTMAEQKLFLLGKLEIREDDSYFISATKTLRSMTKRIEERKHLIESSPYGNNLLNAIKKLEEVIE